MHSALTIKLGWLLWLIGASTIIGLALLYSPLFGYDFEVAEMPLLNLTYVLVAGGLLFLFLPLLIHFTLKSEKPNLNAFLILIFIAGLAFRLAMFWTEPVMEDDYQRYLWDGAVTANGYNPYKYVPQKILDGEGGSRLQELAKASAPVLERVNHPNLRTIYPSVTQVAFATAYFIKPFSMNAWRGVALAMELATFALLLLILKELGRPLLWAALYWLNPLIIKELMNAAHMEVLLVPFLLGALYTSLKKGVLAPVLLLTIGAGIKLWPIFLVPTVLYKVRNEYARVFMLLMLSALLIVLFFVPVLLAGLDNSSGFVAYAKRWQTNSLLSVQTFHLFQNWLDWPSWVNRLIVGLTLSIFALWAALRFENEGPQGNKDHAFKFLLVAAAVFLLSPAQFPWYAVWCLPFIVFFPVPGLIALVAFIQIYYLGFYHNVHDSVDVFRNVWLKIEWIPVWILLAGSVINHYLTARKFKA